MPAMGFRSYADIAGTGDVQRLASGAEARLLQGGGGHRAKNARMAWAMPAKGEDFKLPE